MNLWNYLGPFQCHNFSDLSDFFFYLTMFLHGVYGVFLLGY